MVERDAHYESIYGDAMMDELEKISGIGQSIKGLTKGLTEAGAGRLAGAGLGAGLGAAGGYAMNPEDRARGALSGAFLGGVGGLGVGQVATRAGRGQVKRFGQRQLHGLTGYVPRTAQQKAMGVGITGKGLTRAQRVQALKNMGMDIGEAVPDRAMAIRKAMSEQAFTKLLPSSTRKRLAGLEVSAREAQRQAAERGLTSLPGVAKGMLRDPLGTLRTGIMAQGPMGIALGAGGTAMAVPGMIKGKGYGEEYSREGGAGRFVGENLGYAALGATPVLPMMLGGALVGKAGELIHKGVKRDDKNRAGRIRQ